MTRDAFWNLIDASQSSGDINRQASELETPLAELPEEELVSFDAHFYQLFHAAYRADLWGAAYIINGGCSDDCFDYFRGWLIGRGRAIYDAALENPDSLASVAEEGDGEQEELLSIAVQIYLKRTGKDYSDLEESSPFASVPWPNLVGDLSDWDDADEEVAEEKQERLYPRLFEKFG